MTDTHSERGTQKAVLLKKEARFYMPKISANVIRRTYTADMHEWILSLLTTFSLPEYGLSAVFVMSFISATLVPIGSEPIMFGLLKVNPDLFWPTVGIATVGNTLGVLLVGGLVTQPPVARQNHPQRNVWPRRAHLALVTQLWTQSVFV